MLAARAVATQTGSASHCQYRVVPGSNRAAKAPRNRTGCRLRSVPPLHSETQAEPEYAHCTVRPPPPPQPGASPVQVGAKNIPVALPGRIEHEDYGSHPERGPAERGVKSVPTYEFPEIDPWQDQQNEDDELFETGEGAPAAAHHVRANACPPFVSSSPERVEGEPLGVQFARR